MRQTQLGNAGPVVSTLGLGLMGMSDFYGTADEHESHATIHAALDAGITLLDTGDYYGMGTNEMLLRDALKGRRRSEVVVSVKFGALRAPNGTFLGIDGRPAFVKTSIAYSLKRLGTDYIDIYRPGRVDPAVPIEETVGAMAELVQAGLVRYIGLSEASAATVRRAHAVHPIADLQFEYSLFSRGIETEILPTLRELGIGLTAYGVLSRGLLTDGALTGRSLGGFRSHLPRFRAENLRQNLALVEALRGVANGRGVTVTQLAVAWVLAQGTDIVPVIGARRRESLQEALDAARIELTPQDVGEIERAVPASAVAGDRYPAEQMAILDSERNRSA